MSFAANTGAGNTTTQNQLPAWLQSAYEDNISRAEGVANAPFQAYNGQQTAADNGYLQAARDQAVGSTYAGNGQIDQASKIFGEVADQSPYPNSAQQLAGTNLKPYTDPYQQQVIDAAMGDIKLQQDRSLNDINASTARGAFGGSRQGVENALTREAYDRTAQGTLAGLRSQGFDKATALASEDVNRRTANDQFNSGLDMQNTAMNLQGAQGLLGVAGQKQNQALQGQNALQQAGESLQGGQQAGLDAQYQEFLRQQQDPYQKQTLVNSAVLGISPGAVGTQNQTSNSKAKGLSS